MINVKLICSLDTFKIKAHNLIEGSQILENSEVFNQVTFQSLKTKIKEWEDQLFSLLLESFEDPNEYLKMKFTAANFPRYHMIYYSGMEIAFEEEVQELKHHLFDKRCLLHDFLRVLPVLDGVTSKKNEKIQNAPSNIFALILEKLHILKDGQFYPIDLILEGNGIELINGKEELEQLINEMVKKSWILKTGTNAGKITFKGEIELERLRRINRKNESTHISNKIDSIILKLEKLGYGQEILFEELEELKGLYPKLNKKHWSQILKGKLLDLAVDKVIDMTVVKLISDDFFDNDFSKFLTK